MIATKNEKNNWRLRLAGDTRAFNVNQEEEFDLGAFLLLDVLTAELRVGIS